jgi:hypothetical protein
MSDRIGLSASIPQLTGSYEPIEITDRKANLKAAFVDRDILSSLRSPEWDKDSHGFYVLLSPIDDQNRFTVYVGQTDYSFTRRLFEHNKVKDFWRSAVLFKHVNHSDFNRMHTRYLEGLLVDAMKAYPNATVTNIKPTGEKDLSPEDKSWMDDVLEGVLRVLQLRGYYRNVAPATFGVAGSQAPVDANSKAVRRPPQVTAITVPSVSVPSVPVFTPSVVTPAPETVAVSPQPITAPVESVPNKSTPAHDAEPFLSLRELMKQIGKSDPSRYSSYKLWASNAILESIILINPKTKDELNRIHGVGANIMSRADDVLTILKKHSPKEDKPVKRGWFKRS